MDGSGRVTDRNRQYLRQFTEVTNSQPGPRPETSYTRNPVAEPEHRQVVQPEPEYRPVVKPEPVVPQPVLIVPDTIPEPQAPSTPRQVVLPVPTSPTTPESPSFVTPPTTPTVVEPPRRSTRIQRPPDRLNYDKF